MRTALLALTALALLPTATLGASCQAQSGDRTAALVELYTSEGCDSCPPADRWLSSLGSRGLAPDRVVPVSLHVDYWDYLGWKDPYAKRAFTDRQRRLARLKRAPVIYTPQVVLQGEDFRGWRTGAFERAVERINAQPAKARIRLQMPPPDDSGIDLAVTAEVIDPARRGDAAMYLGAYENKLVSEVQAGENRGRTLAHDYVVLQWEGPIDIPAGGRIETRRRLPLLPKAVPAHSGVVAFVQDRRTAEVLQALMLPACPR